MAFKDDLKATFRIWKRGSVLWKIITSVGILAGAISFLSISDTVFEFKGVVVRLVHFYRELLAPLTEYLGKVYQLGPYDADLLVLSTIFWVAFGRGMTAADDDWLTGTISSIAVSGVFIAFSLAMLIYTHWLLVVLILSATFAGLIYTIRDADEPKQERLEDLLIIEAFAVQLLIAFLAIAVSEGIMRPLV